MTTNKIDVSDLTEFEVVNFPHGDDDIAAYLTAVLEENDASLLAFALGDMVRTRGMSNIGWDERIAAAGLIKLLAIAQQIVHDSTAADAEGFNTVKWLVQWIERPQPALGKRKAIELIGVPAGLEAVIHLLGTIESGVYL